MKHDDFVGMDQERQELYTVKKHFSIQVEGDPDFFFNVSLVQDDGEEELDQQEVLPTVADDELMGQNHGRQNNLVVALTGLMDVDDDNEPVLENFPVCTAPPHPSVLSQEWGHDGFCLRKSNNLPDAKAKLVYLVNTTRNDINLQLFEHFFPRAFMEDVMIAETNKILDQHPLSYGELLCWIRLWVLISMVDGSDCWSFWSTKKINMYKGVPYCLSSYMTQRCFEEILSALQYTNRTPTQQHDRFWEICQLIEVWNAHMMENFIPSWINAIGESMSKWINEYTCPGYMYVPRKPWKFGNEYHNMGCALSDVIWQVDLHEGKDQPAHLGKKEYDELRSTVGTLLHLTKPIHGTGKVFALDSGVCVLQGLAELKKKGIFTHALIKKRRYWPKHILGEEIIAHFTDKPIGAADAIKDELDGMPFYIFGMKETDYVMQIMSTYGMLAMMGEEKHHHVMVSGTKQVITFKYPEVVHNHYWYRDVIGNHNSRQMHPISMEETWMTTHWTNCIFCFLLAVTMVNVQNAGVYFCSFPKVNSLTAHKLITQQLIENRYLIVEQSLPKKQPRCGEASHHLMALPTHRNLRMDNWSIAKQNIKPGIAFAGLLVSGHTAPVLQDCFYVLNVMLSTKLMHQWPILSVYNSAF